MNLPPDDLDEVILGRMVKEAGMFYKMELELKVQQRGIEKIEKNKLLD